MAMTRMMPPTAQAVMMRLGERMRGPSKSDVPTLAHSPGAEDKRRQG
jgi:hypothetical protein